jgi:hypothetical protein
MTSRRDFIKKAGLAAGAVTIVPRYVLGGKGFVAPSDKIYVAGIGVGGKGESDIAMFAKSGKAEISFLCDVDDRRAANTIKNFPKAKYYKDYRKMLDENHKSIDAVSVSTPDHMHAIQAMAAMELGKHVYVQKPLTHDIAEARMLTEAAKKYKVVTQMGNQGASGDGVRQMREWYEAGLIGDVHTVYCHKEFHGLIRKQRYQKSWIGTCGWVLHPLRIMLRRLCLSTGAGGGTMAPGLWATWRVILLNLHSVFLGLVIQPK